MNNLERAYKEVAEELGIKVAAKATKADIIAAIEAK